MLTSVMGVAVAAAEGAEEHAELPMPALAYGAIIFGIFMALMFITLAFTSVGRRHEATSEHDDPHRQHPANHQVPGN